MSQPPPGWYPDPAGRGRRWWDGEGWTDRRVIDAIRTTIEGKEFVADTERIALGETVLATDAIDTVAFDVWQRKYDFRRYGFWLGAGSKKLNFSFEYPGSGPPATYSELITFLDEHVLPRIAGELASQIGAGETVRIGSFDADRQGITGRARLGRVTVPWAGIRKVSRGRQYLFVSGLDASGRARTLRTTMVKRNVVSLLHLVDLMQRGNEERASLHSAH